MSAPMRANRARLGRVAVTVTAGVKGDGAGGVGGRGRRRLRRDIGALDQAIENYMRA
jgi:hypothetical protein